MSADAAMDNDMESDMNVAMDAATFSAYLNGFNADVARLREVMLANLGSDVEVIADMKTQAYFTGGKQLRAIVAGLSARLHKAPQPVGDRAAVAIEFIHTATLLHDDVVDDAPLRRHLPAAAKVYGNAAAVLAGDFLYSRASQMLAALENLPLLKRVADTSNMLAEGELLQLLQRGKADVSEEMYYSIIRRKTANLFSVAAATGAILSGNDDSALSAYGEHFGIAFQLVDDCLDYEGAADETGKKIGADFQEKKVTLPIALMLRALDDTRRSEFMRQWRQRPADSAFFSEARALLDETGALRATREIAGENAQAAQRALAGYADGDEKTALIRLVRYSAARQK